MPGPATDPDAWKRLVLQSMAPPAWLQLPGPDREIVLSTRVRIMRNLRGRRFPHRASSEELRDVLAYVRGRLAADAGFELVARPSMAERDYMVACRLVSPDFDWDAPGRGVLLDATRTVSLMANEEDHIRLQALTSGWALKTALREAEGVLALLGPESEFANSEHFGYLAASPPNCGAGVRYSAMFHLIGLAHTRRLPDVIRALGSQNLVVRGIFGERSRAVGALAQVSSTSGSVPQFVGACDYLLEQEQRARAGVGPAELAMKRQEAEDYVESKRSLTLSDALRVLAWRRWPDGNGGAQPIRIDAMLPELALLESLGDPRAGAARVRLLRTE